MGEPPWKSVGSGCWFMMRNAGNQHEMKSGTEKWAHGMIGRTLGARYMAHATWRMLHGALLSWEPNELSSFVAASVRCSPCSAKASATTRRSALRGRSWAGSCQRHAKQRYHCHRDEINPHIFCVILLESFIYTFLHTRFHDNLHAGYYYK